jgi:Cytochrome c3/Class III cytochrome C family
MNNMSEITLNVVPGFFPKIVCLILFILFPMYMGFAQSNDDCLMCHDDSGFKEKVNGKVISLYLNPAVFNKSVHADLECVDCHSDIDPDETPHRTEYTPVNCGTCHDEEAELYSECMHGKARASGDKLAPLCQDCHGKHDILPVKDRNSAVATMKIPFLCGKCHHEGTPVQLQHNIPQDRILENYTESIHGEALLLKGLIVAPTCISCHSAHRILPHTDSRSTIARNNIATTCTKCHAEIETVHRKIIKGELWEKQAHVLPACVDCHQPHQIRKVFYDYGMADKDCLSCHDNPNLKSSVDGRSLFVNYTELKGSRHSNIACSQCHSEVNVSKHRPCETITQKVQCASCHDEIGIQYSKSTHGTLFAKNDTNAPTCKECHGTHGILGKLNPQSRTFATNIPDLCGTCHRDGEIAAVKYKGKEKDIIKNYSESIHGKGLLKSGLTVTATCTDCHTAHMELPHTNPESSINPKNVAETCGKCHHGIEEQFVKSIHSPLVSNTDKQLPGCADCHSAHTITRTDADGFKLQIMNQCGRCHEKIAETYFDTYHGKVSQLGYTKTAKCYDCHGSHDILPPSDPKSRLSRQNVVNTCKTCHPNANRQFAGYLTHATHHDPVKYPILFWVFWGMTGLLVGTFVIAGVHTLLWLPRSLQWRRKLKSLHLEDENNSTENNTGEESEGKIK